MMIPPDWVKDAIFYQIFPDRFYNGDTSNDPPDKADWYDKPTPHNFFGGDIAGIIEKLDYIEELGANAIYLNPIFKAPSNHKYDTEDYYMVDPHFGDECILKELVKKAHERGIRIILDGVFNHCGEKFFAFQDVVEKGEKSKYKDWFKIYKFPISKYPEPNYACWAGVPSMPEFNTKNPKVRDYLLNVVKYWIEKVDIDGWRLDAVEYMEVSFVRDIRRMAKSVKKDSYIFGEVIGIATSWFKEDALDGVMNYKLWDLIVDFFANEKYDVSTFKHSLYFLRRSYPDWANYAMYNLLGSHDRPRFLTLCGGKVEKVKLALVFLMTYIGAPSIYYGDEIGMEGMGDPDCRKAFVWDEERQNIELLNFFKFMIRLRKNYNALRRGRFRQIDIDKRIFSYLRYTDDQAIIVILNNSDKRINVDFTFDINYTNMHCIFDHLVSSKGNRVILDIPEYGYELIVYTK